MKIVINNHFPTILLLSLSMLIPIKSIRAGNMQEVITSICLAGFNSEMEAAGKIYNKAMGDFACKCFVQRVSNGYSLIQARDLCKESTSIKFKI